MTFDKGYKFKPPYRVDVLAHGLCSRTMSDMGQTARVVDSTGRVALVSGPFHSDDKEVEWCEKVAAALNDHAQRDELVKALQQCERLFKEALPKFNWSASALDANAIQLLNETPAVVGAALSRATQQGKS
jgi:hypothetical protein